MVRYFLLLPIHLHAATVGQQLKNSGSYVAHIHAIKFYTITAHHLSNNTRIVFGCHAVRLRGLFVSLLADSATRRINPVISASVMLLTSLHPAKFFQFLAVAVAYIKSKILMLCLECTKRHQRRHARVYLVR